MTNATPTRTSQWRVIDIVTAAVLGVAVGLIFWGWNTIGYAGFSALDALTPGFGGLFAGIWFLGGPLGALIIRKPGAAIFVEVIAASVSTLIGSQWGIETLYSGLAQGLGAEIVFMLFVYSRFTPVVAALSGVGSALGAFIVELFTAENLAKTLEYNLIYLGCMSISGIVLAGLLSYWLVKALAQTGALDRFAAGRGLNPGKWTRSFNQMRF
ncbi:ECF transporter S component [Corynebacterium mayonis]|uniref:ECF transporter S component n=1 Tax=Corynebacterium mayonis TaxID=3062461 RepID=UPI003140A620